MSVGITGEWPNVIDVWVPNIEWREIQPGRDEFRFASIDAMIERARASGDSLRLRILAGRYAPAWVKRRFGTVRIHLPLDDIAADVPRWWVPGYMEVYERLQSRLAAAYDGDATVRSVTVSGAMTMWAEPFLRGISSPLTRRNLVRAGYTPAKDRRALSASIAAQTPWKRTRQVLAVNPWQFVRTDGSFGSETVFTNHMMERFRYIFGDRAILQNNSIRASWIGNMPPLYAAMYRHMRALGGPISFQTARLSLVGDLRKVLAWCVAHGAHGVELPPGSAKVLTAAEARSFDATLERNARDRARSVRHEGDDPRAVAPFA
jgi:hypothetical protein